MLSVFSFWVSFYCSTIAEETRMSDQMKLEEMAAFFENRLEGYDEHMRRDIEGGSDFYAFTASRLPQAREAEVLDLGCGTGLELEEYFGLNPDASVTGIDLCRPMLDALAAKFPQKQLVMVCGSYFDADLQPDHYDAAVSVESLHHFPAARKRALYRKLFSALKQNGYFVLTDYFAESEALEKEYFQNLEQLKREQGLDAGTFYHYDTPLTVEHEMEILREAGFKDVRILRQWGSTYTVYAGKQEPLDILEAAKRLYALEEYDLAAVSAHEGGRNQLYVCRKEGESRFVLRISALGDRGEDEYLAETEFVRYLAENGAPVADVMPSVHGKLAERYENEEQDDFISLFAYAKGMLISDNGYRYREGAPLSEYFYNTGKALGKIHRLSKTYQPVHRRGSYFDKYNMEYIHRLIPDDYAELKQAIAQRLDIFHDLPQDGDSFGLVHFDFSDGNYHIDMETGDLTVFDFDNCIYCWYMFDLANLWTHGVGWFQSEPDAAKRMEGMKRYFDTVLEGYKSETDVSEALLAQLPLFIDMVLIENIVDEFECCAREGEEVDEEDIEDAAECLIRDIPFAGFGEN